MSLESEIKALTAAITRLIDEAMQCFARAQGVAHPTYAPLSTMSVPDNDVKATPAELAKGYGGSPEQVAKVVPPKSEAAQPAAAGQAAETSEAGGVGTEVVAPTFDDAKRAFLAIAQKYGAVEGTAKSKEVLARYGVPSLKALGAEQYPDFIALCGTVVEGGAA